MKKAFQWKNKQLSEIATVIMGQSPSSENYNDKREGLPLIQGNADCRDRKTRPRIWTREITKRCKKQDLIMTVRAPVGSISRSFHDACIGRGICAIRGSKTVTDFLYQYFMYLEPKWKRYEQGSTFTAITGKELKKINILFPPLPEQKKIAEILSCWDEAIEKTEKLIYAKKTFKKGVMQRLLSGTVRFKEFNCKWGRKKIGEIGQISSAGVDKKIIESEQEVYLLNYMDVYQHDFISDELVNHKVTASNDKLKKCNIKTGDIFFTPTSETRDDIGHSAVVIGDIVRGVYSYHLVRFRPKIPLYLKFRGYMFKTDDYYRQVCRLADGSGQRYVISQNYFRNITVDIPPFEEQKRIADTFSAIDKENNLLEKKCEALKKQKKGLMQKLLTGKIRVKVK